MQKLTEMFDPRIAGLAVAVAMTLLETSLVFAAVTF